MLKKKKFITSLTTACVMLVSAFAIFPKGTTITTYAEFESDAHEVVSEITLGWNLGNTLDSYTGTTMQVGSLSSETSWGNPKTTKEMIDYIKSTGINAIRVPVTWYNHMNPDTYEIDEAWMARVEEVVNYVLDNDMYCIINVHHDTGEKGWLKVSSTDLEEKEAKFTAIWEQVSENFSSYGDKLLFEGFNEILDDESNWVTTSQDALDITNELNQIFVDTVRSSGGNNSQRCLIVNTYCAGATSQIVKGFELPTDTVSDRLIVEAHVYQPFYFTYEAYPDVTTWNKSELDTQLGNLYNTFVQNDIPVIIGEFGCVGKNNQLERLSWAKYYVETCTDYGIKCFWWDNGDQYKIFNRRTLTCTEPEILEAMLTEAQGGDYIIDTSILGDANNDSSITAIDVLILKKYILGQTVEVKNCDMNSDGTINIIDLTMLKQIFFTQENLCESIDNWASWVDQENGADAEVTYLENGMSITVNDSGTYEWNVQGAYKNLALEGGATYQVSFDYYSDVEQTMTFNVQQNYGDYVPYYSGSLDYATEVQHYQGTFTMSAKDDNNVQIAFNFGASSLDTTYTMTIENLKLVKLSD